MGDGNGGRKRSSVLVGSLMRGRRSFIGVFGYSEKTSHQGAQSNGGNTKETKTERLKARGGEKN